MAAAAKRLELVAASRLHLIVAVPMVVGAAALLPACALLCRSI